MKRIATVLSLSMLLFLPACEGLDGLFGDDSEDGWSAWGYGVEEGDDAWGWGYDDGFGEPIDANNGELGGDYGEIDHPEPVPADVSGWDDYGFARVEVMAYSNQGVSMAIIEVYGGLDQEELEPGTSRTYSADEAYGYGEGADVMVTGCAGQEAYDWMYDDMADEVRVEVTEDPEDPGLRTYSFEADFRQYDWQGDTYGSRTTTLEGSFQARVGSVAGE
jgi:hypothetical protein